jgi:ubiquinone/menaquinone biosynthesis methyltransferase
MSYQKTPAYLATLDAKRVYNTWLFGIVAERYNIVTKVLSFGRDRVWKKWLIDNIPKSNPQVIIDMASGTGDVAFALTQTFPCSRIVAADLTLAMFALHNDTKLRLLYAVQDMSLLGFKNKCADIITGSYMLRNAPDINTALAETARVLKPGGTAAFLDFSKPTSKILAGAEYLLLKIWGSLWGLVFHGKPQIYGYIAESLRTFPDCQKIRMMLKEHNFEILRSKKFFFGVIEVIICKLR